MKANFLKLNIEGYGEFFSGITPLYITISYIYSALWTEEVTKHYIAKNGNNKN
jgi:hypothetical protein